MSCESMGQKAQAGLEYLMTYGWALVLIAIIVGALVFVASSPSSQATFSSSDPTKIMVKAGNIDLSTTVDNVEVVLQNITGGEITITKIDLTAPFSGCKLNGIEFAPGAEISTVIPAGGELRFTEIDYSGSGTGKITIHYTDFAKLQRTVVINGSAAGGGTVSGCSVDGDCTGGKICCGGSCQYPVCSATILCNDNDSCTTDTCNNSGTCNASCSYSPITPCCGNGSCETGEGEDCSGCPTDCGVCTTGLVAFWNFDEASGGQVLDASGNGNSGMLYGPTRQIAGCPSNGCVSFNGTSDFVQMGTNNPSYSEIAGNQLTIEAWIKPASLTGDSTIIIKNGPFWLQKVGNKFVVALNTAFGGPWPPDPLVNGAIPLTTGWNHVAVTYNGSQIRLFVNGQADTSSPDTGDIMGSGCVEIGRYNNAYCDQGVSSYFGGQMDEVKIWKRSLSPEEICTECKEHASAAGISCACS